MSDPTADEARRLRSELRLAEYRSVREEWLTSRGVQQHVLQWTLAALAVLIAGVLNSGAHDAQPFLYVALSAAVVAVATASQGIWWGEVLRMARTSLYLRGFERELGRPPAGELPALMWERWRGDPALSWGTSWITKAHSSIVGGVALYGLIAAAGFVMLVAAAADKTVPHGDRHAAVALACATGALYLLTTGLMCWQAVVIYRGSGDAAGFEGFRGEA